MPWYRYKRRPCFCALYGIEHYEFGQNDRISWNAFCWMFSCLLTFDNSGACVGTLRTLSKTSSCSKWGAKHSWYKNRLVKTRCLPHLKQLPRRFTLCLSAPLRTTRELLKRVRSVPTQAPELLKFSKDSNNRQQQKALPRNSLFCTLK